MTDRLTPLDTEQLVRRIRSEYLEMPGLQLSCRQAQRLFHLSEPTCSALLDVLVRDKFLARRPDGRYARIAEETLARGRQARRTSPADDLAVPV